MKTAFYDMKNKLKILRITQIFDQGIMFLKSRQNHNFDKTCVTR